MGGILGYGTYIPYNRLQRSAIGEALGTAAGRGTRAVASYDEDTTSMAVEASRVLLRGLPVDPDLDGLWLSTVDPAYLDKTNATAVHAALGLSPSVPASDRNGSVRSAAATTADALQASGQRTLLSACSDVRTGLPGSADESEGGDGAAAFLTGPGDPALPVLAELLGTASCTAEFLDRWRVPGDGSSKVWEERFGEFAYLPLAEEALSRALARAGVDREQISHLVVTGTQPRAVRRFAAASGVPRDVISSDLASELGQSGAAHLGVVLADVLDRAGPGELIVALSLSDGADAIVLRSTEALVAGRNARPSVRSQIDAGWSGLSYPSFLTWRGQLRREPPRRPDPDRPAAPPSYRAERWKFAFEGSRCTNKLEGGRECGMRHLPPQRVCVRCHAVDKMVPDRFADTIGTVATFTVDRLAFSPSPPLVAAVIDFDGGGRFRCELTDVGPTPVAIGDRVEMTFRRLYTADGVHDYFWKARPVRDPGTAGGR